MSAKHARILSLLEMSAVMLGTAGEVSVPVIQATPDTSVKNLVRILKQAPPRGLRGSQGFPFENYCSDAGDCWRGFCVCETGYTGYKFQESCKNLKGFAQESHGGPIAGMSEAGGQIFRHACIGVPGESQGGPRWVPGVPFWK